MYNLYFKITIALTITLQKEAFWETGKGSDISKIHMAIKTRSVSGVFIESFAKICLFYLNKIQILMFTARKQSCCFWKKSQFSLWYSWCLCFFISCCDNKYLNKLSTQEEGIIWFTIPFQSTTEEWRQK